MRIKYLLIGFLSIFFLRIAGQSFQDFIFELNHLPPESRQSAVDSFLLVKPHSPVIESDTIANYYFTGNVASISIAGDATGWKPEVDVMRLLPGTIFWYFTAHYAEDTRIDYKLVLNGKDWIPDPRNADSIRSGFGMNSELAMPGYIPPPEINFYNSISHGTIFDTVFFSKSLRNSRTVQVYIPAPSGWSHPKFPVIVFHDGQDFLSLGNAKNILDYLIANGMITPVIGVFIPPVNRDEEYHGKHKEEYTEFIIEDVLGWLDRKYPTLTDPKYRALTGVSDGGNISLWMAVNRPDVFGKVAVFSSNVINEILNEIQNKPAQPVKFYLDIGKYDIDVLITMTGNLSKLLGSQGYDSVLKEWNEGHSWGSWRAHLDEPLKVFFPAD